jgi:uncharacterized protein YcbX
MNIGMIGIGLMGHGIASNLVKHGHALTVLDHPGNQPLDALRAAGAVAVSSAREVAQGAQVVILVVTGSPQVEAVLTGPAGVLEGLQPWDEDHLHEIDVDTGAGVATLRLVKPCVRCSIPDVDPATADTGTAVARTLAGFRADPRMNGGLTFGINAVVVAGAGLVLRTGQPVAVRHAFG